MELKPGMYVKTAGMDDEQYHQVAEAFMQAGAKIGEPPDDGYRLGWLHIGMDANGELWHWNNPEYFGPNAQEITLEEALGEEQTPCEKLGYKVGDRFEVLDHEKCANSGNGEIVILDRDDGTEAPYFTREAGGTDCCYLGAIRPASTNWAGEGLPPVGTHCETLAPDRKWVPVEILAHHPRENTAWFQRTDGELFDGKSYSSSSACFFRPPQSDREREIDRISSDGGISFCAASRIYHSGYRKTEGNQ